LGVDRARDDQAVDRARHRDVVETQTLGLLLALDLSTHLVVAGRAASLAGRRVHDLEAEASVRERKDLVGCRRLAIASRVRDHDDLELEALRAVDRQQADRVPALFFGDGLELASADRLLLGDKTDE